MAAATLESQLKSAQGAITFLQKEHSGVLNGLHQEIKKLQQKCSELQYGLNVRIGLVESGEYYEQQIAQLQNELAQKTRMCKELETQLSSKDVEIEKLRNQLQWRENEMRTELTEKTIRLKDLQDKLQERTELLAHLSSHLRHVRHPAPSTSKSHSPAKPSNGESTQHHAVDSPSKHKHSTTRSTTPHTTTRLLTKRPQKSDLEVIHLIHPPLFPDPSTIDTTSTTSSLDTTSDTDYLPPDFKATVAALPPIKDLNQGAPRVNQTFQIRRSDLTRGTIPPPTTHNLVDVTTLAAVDHVSPEHTRGRRLNTETLHSSDT